MKLQCFISESSKTFLIGKRKGFKQVPHHNMSEFLIPRKKEETITECPDVDEIYVHPEGKTCPAKLGSHSFTVDTNQDIEAR